MPGGSGSRWGVGTGTSPGSLEQRPAGVGSTLPHWVTTVWLTQGQATKVVIKASACRPRGQARRSSGPALLEELNLEQGDTVARQKREVL